MLVPGPVRVSGRFVPGVYATQGVTVSEHLTRRGGRYYYRRRVPSDLVEKYGRKEHTQALGTADKKEATEAARRAAVRLDEIFRRLRAEINTSLPASLDTPLPTVYRPVSRIPLDEVLDHEERVEAQREEDAREARIEEIKDAIRALYGDTPVPLSASIARPEIDMGPVVPDTPPQPVSAPVVESKSGFPEAIKEWQRKRTPGPGAVDGMNLTVSRFFEVCGRVSLQAVTRDHVKKYQDHYLAAGMNPGTVRYYSSLLKALLSVAFDSGMIKSNPAIGVKLDRPKKAPKASRVAFALEDIRVILERLPTEGNYHWIPLVGLYTGMRLEEICQLAPEDIKEETYRDAHGKTRKVSVIYATDEGDNQGLKNAGSRRKVPVHAELVKAGFVDYVKAQSGPRIFPGLKANKAGREGANASIWFGKFLREKCEITDPRKVFHSFRHLFKDVLREHGVQEQVSDALTGHTNGSVGRTYGGDYYPLRPLVEAVGQFELHL
jgi:integrase